jgi:hypothetical protein
VSKIREWSTAMSELRDFWTKVVGPTKAIAQTTVSEGEPHGSQEEPQITEARQGGPGTCALLSIAITPEVAFIDGGSQRQYTATGHFSDGHSEDLTDMVEWSSSLPGVLAIADGGLATAEPMSGTATITATESVSGVTGTLKVEITEEAPSTSASGTTVQFAFYAFIPGSLGKSFGSYPYPSDLANQAAFEGMVKGVSGTWLPEPGTFEGLSTGPWCYATDNRGFGGGSHRVGFTGSVSAADIGKLKSKGTIFHHDTSGSERVRWEHTGYVTSSKETGSLNGPISASAGVSSSEEHKDISADESVVTVSGSAGYPFSLAAPNIDYKLVLRFERQPDGKVVVSGDITTNIFPFYELLINGTAAWRYSSSGTGPGVWNLNSSQTSKLAPKSY